MAYSEAVIRHYENPSNVGKMDSSDIDVGTGLVGAGPEGRTELLRRWPQPPVRFQSERF